MKTRVLLVFSLFLFARISTAQYVTIPDPSFRSCLKQAYPICFNSQDMLDTTCGELQTTTVDCSYRSDIANLDGIQYFKKLNRLSVIFNKLTSLPTLPKTLTWLDCSMNQLTSLPTLPSSLEYLNCWDNQLTSLPALPKNLTLLYCSKNKLTGLPTLSNSLIFLDCSTNSLTSLPTLSNVLNGLNCSNNQLTDLPALPNTLTELYCSNNRLTNLPTLPSALTWLHCNNNPNLTCLPFLPSLNGLNVSNTLVTCLPNRPSGLANPLPVCTTPCVLGVESSPEVVNLTVSPNPATESYRLDYDTQGKFSVLTLVDVLGRAVKSVELQGSGQHEFSVADIPLGLYYLSVKTEGQPLATGKLVVGK